jgi:hypothetical protein
MVEALSIYKNWKGYTFDYEGSQKLVFCLKEPNSCLVKNNPMRISTEPRVSNKDWDFEIKGYFPDKDCSIIDAKGNVVAQASHDFVCELVHCRGRQVIMSEMD